MIEPLRNRAMNWVLSQLSRSFAEEKVAGHMDALIDAMTSAAKPGGAEKIETMIADIDTLSSGLECMDIYRKQLDAKVHTLNPYQFESCLKSLGDSVETHSENQYLRMMQNYFLSCKNSDIRIRAYFNKFFELNKEPDLNGFSRPTRILSIPVYSLGFPEEYASVKSLARDLVKKIE